MNRDRTNPPTIEPKIPRQLLDELPQTPAGVLIHEQLTQLIHEWVGVHAAIASHRAAITEGFALLLAFLLEEFARDPSSEHVLEINAWVIRARHAYRAQLTAPGAVAIDPDTQAIMAVLREGITKLVRTLAHKAPELVAAARHHGRGEAAGSGGSAAQAVRSGTAG